MDKMTVRVPVAIKAKVTEDLKLKIIGDLQNTIKNMELDLEQFEFQAAGFARANRHGKK